MERSRLGPPHPPSIMMEAKVFTQAEAFRATALSPRRRDQLRSPTSTLLHSVAKRVNLKEEADASHDHAVVQFLLALPKEQQGERRP